MNKEDFRILKELNSLEQKKKTISELLANELQRIDKIQQMRSKRDLELSQLKTALEDLKKQMTIQENELSLTDQKLEQSNSKENQIKTLTEEKALKTQIQSLNSRKEELENKLFESLEKIESIELKIQQATSFLSGSLETISELENDIVQENQESYQDLKNIEKRIPQLRDELHPKVVEKLLRLQAKSPNFVPLSQLTDRNTCELCGYLIPKALVDAIETKMRFSGCPGCERIIIPQSVKYL